MTQVRDFMDTIEEIITMITVSIEIYDEWNTYSLWLQVMLQLIPLCLIGTCYSFVMSLFVKELMNLYTKNQYDGSLLFVTSLIGFVLPILCYGFYINTLDKIYALIVEYMFVDRDQENDERMREQQEWRRLSESMSRITNENQYDDQPSNQGFNNRTNYNLYRPQNVYHRRFSNNHQSTISTTRISW